jgi:glycosyltransferase involved in cell wall biosynthesis
MTPRISVIMPVYNADASLAGAVAAVLAQTFRDFELIIVDDGSRDGSAGLARLLAIDDRRIRPLRQLHGGDASARNRGIAVARGEYLAFLGATDIWAPTRLARHLAVMDRTPDCGVTLDAGEGVSMPFVHRAVFAEAGPFNVELAEGADREWLARVQDLTDWQIQRLGGPAVPQAAAPDARLPAPPRPAPMPRAPRRRLGGLAAFLAGPRGRQVLAP